MEKQTLAIHQIYKCRDAYDVLSMPVYNAVVFEFDNAETMAGAFRGRIDAPNYSRMENPTVTNLKQRVKALTGVENVIALNSGVAVIGNTLFSTVEQGKNVITSRRFFGNTYSLFTSILSRLGVEAKLYDLTGVKTVERLMDDKTCCLLLEVMTNPQFKAADVRVLSAIAYRYSTAVIADTMPTPFTQFSAEDLGIGLEIASSTKYISGGITFLGGLVIDYSTYPSIDKRLLNEMLSSLRTYMVPQVVHTQTLGSGTLDIRYCVQTGNALELAQRLRTLRPICKVDHVSLENSPYHQLVVSQYGETAGAVVTIDLEDQEACFGILDNLKLIHQATSPSDNRTLAIRPASTISGFLTVGECAAMDVQDTIIRLSVGLESVDDPSDDIKWALEAW